jgi:hypothetical protein
MGVGRMVVVRRSGGGTSREGTSGGAVPDRFGCFIDRQRQSGWVVGVRNVSGATVGVGVGL